MEVIEPQTDKPNAAMIRAAMDDVYRRCETRSELLVIVLDALDQAGATLRVQGLVRDVIRAWDGDSLDDAMSAWERSGR